MIKDRISLPGIDQLITSDDLLGKDVIDFNGDFIGVTESLFINPENLDFFGISIDKGFLKRGLIIGKDYIKNVTPYAIFLKIRPAYNIKGMRVYDIEGQNIGKVTKILLKESKNQIEKIIISPGIIKRKLEIDAGLIKSIGESVFLLIKKSEL